MKINLLIMKDISSEIISHSKGFKSQDTTKTKPSIVSFELLQVITQPISAETQSSYVTIAVEDSKRQE